MNTADPMQPSAETALVSLQRLGSTYIATLHNPPVNAVSDAVLAALDRALDQVEADADARVLVVCGGSRAFSAGSDIKEFPSYLGRDAFINDKLVRENRVYSRLADAPLPTIAAIEGMALGGGLELAVCCDFVVAASNARLGLPEITIGGFPGSGGVVRIPRRIGFARAARMMFFGDPIDAATALQWGLIDEVGPPGAAFDVALRLARRLETGPAVALRACKAALVAARRSHEPEALRESLRASARIAASEDFRESIEAFMEKRPSPLSLRNSQ